MIESPEPTKPLRPLGTCETCGETIWEVARVFVNSDHGLLIQVEYRAKCRCGEIPLPDDEEEDDTILR